MAVAGVSYLPVIIGVVVGVCFLAALAVVAVVLRRRMKREEPGFRVKMSRDRYVAGPEQP